MKNILILMALFTLLPGCDQLLSPKDYDDCILKNMKGVSSDLGAHQIRKSCRKKFPEVSEFKFKEEKVDGWNK